MLEMNMKAGRHIKTTQILNLLPDGLSCDLVVQNYKGRLIKGNEIKVIMELEGEGLPVLIESAVF